ncbi:hypothetical protein CEXT_390611, partial [Caerostris extrusa]
YPASSKGYILQDSVRDVVYRSFDSEFSLWWEPDFNTQSAQKSETSGHTQKDLVKDIQMPN